MISINHIAIYVRDLETMRAFYERWFEARPGNLYHNPKSDFKSYFLKFDSGATLELMTRPEVTALSKNGYTLGMAHLAFSVGSAKAVNELTARLHGEGYEIVSGPRTTGDGCYESCIRDPEGNIIEITI